MDFLPHPTHPEATDLKMWVGVESYPQVGMAVAEYTSGIGVSKRLPSKTIPTGIVPGVSRLFLAHKKAIIMPGTEVTLRDVAEELVRRGGLGTLFDLDELDAPWQTQDYLLPDDFVPACVLTLTMALDSLEPEDRKAVIEQYGITYHPGVFGYCFLGKLQYVCREGENELPEHLAHLADEIDAVHDVYMDDDVYGEETEED